MTKVPECAPGEISRRQLLGGASALIAAGAAGSGFLPGAARAAGPRRGGLIKFGVEGGAQDNVLDPGTYGTQFVQNAGYMWGNGLVEIDRDGKLIPELAVEWSPDAAAKNWVFKIRNGVEFHNGKSLTAEDVAYSLNHHRGKDSKSLARNVFAGVADIKATAPLEITVSLSSANVDLPGLMADYHLLIMPDGGDPNAGIGTGPYVIEKFEPGVIVRGRRNENYWKAGRAHADVVEIIAINDIVARQSALQGGVVHFITRPDPKLGALIKSNPSLKWFDLQSAMHYLFAMRCDTGPFDNNDLRLAMKYAVDRQDLLTRVFAGSGKLANDHPVPSFDPMFSAEVPIRSYDPDKAKFHYKKSGYSGPIQLSVSDAGFTSATAAATLYKEHAAKAGIDIELNRVPADGYWSEVWKKKPFCPAYWGGRVSAGLMLQAVYTSESPNNETFWRRPAFDSLLAQAQAELDVARRKEMFHDLQMMLWEDGGTVQPMFANTLFATTANVDGFDPAPLFTAFRAAEQLYLTS